MTPREQFDTYKALLRTVLQAQGKDASAIDQQYVWPHGDAAPPSEPAEEAPQPERIDAFDPRW
jgi:hypothetical protein